MNIKTAVFPVAGLGTRFLPATKAIPKEMLPIVDKPLIQYAVEEAYSAGFRHMIFVTGRNKRAIEDHFDTAYELENELQLNDKKELLSIVESIRLKDAHFSFVRQSRPLGLGHAVLCAEPLVGNSPFAVLLADDLMVNDGKSGAVLGQMMAQFEKTNSSIIAVQDVDQSSANRYGIISTSEINSKLMKINHIVEKPKSGTEPSLISVVGRYIFTNKIFSEIHKNKSLDVGEIQLTTGISGLLKNEDIYGFRFEGKRFDCGSREGFLEATVELALKDPKLNFRFKNFILELNL